MDKQMIDISQRLLTVAGFIRDGSVVADIGTDHAYLPVYLIQSKKAQRVIAMDVNKGPLSKAKANIQAYGTDNYIELRLSDGLEGLSAGEADTITISGMGGKLIERILTEGSDKITDATSLVLSPQSEWMHFRQFLSENGFVIQDECMIKDEGKYYIILCCRRNGESTSHRENITVAEYAEYMYGKCLMDKKDKVLNEYLLAERKLYRKVKKTVKDSDSDRAQERLAQIDYELAAIEYALVRNGEGSDNS